MRKSISRNIFDIINAIIMIGISILALYPFLNQLAISFSSTSAVMSGSITVYPKEFTLDTYRDIVKGGDFWNCYKNTIIYVIVGTALGLIFTTMCSYALSKKIAGRKGLLFFIVFTMYFSGGLIPSYLLMNQLRLSGTIWSVVLPSMILPYHILLMKTYFESLPEELEDASKIDGLSQFGYFIRVAIPLSKPIIATMILFISVIYWNDWFNALIYLNDNNQYPVTLYLRNVLMGASVAAQNGAVDSSSSRQLPQAVQAASLILVIFPVLCVYPFVQKHFTKGIMLGAIKG